MLMREENKNRKIFTMYKDIGTDIIYTVKEVAVEMTEHDRCLNSTGKRYATVTLEYSTSN